MPKKFLIGSTLAVIIVLAGFSSIASAQTAELKDIHSSIVQRLLGKQKLLSDWSSGAIILSLILGLIITVIALLSGWTM